VAETDAEARDKAVHGWLVESPQAVTEKLRQMYDDIGGCECLLVLPFDHSEITPGGKTHSAYWLRRSCHMLPMCSRTQRQSHVVLADSLALT
jgi:hypothetical protein